MFANGPGDQDSIPGRAIPKTQKIVLDASLLNTQHYKLWIKGKVEPSILCPHQPATRSDNTVSVAQGGTTTPGTTKQILPLDRVFKYIYIYIYIIYIYIYMPDQLKGEITLYIHLHFLCSLWFLKCVYFRALVSLRACRNRFLMLRNNMGMVVPCAFYSCWRLFLIESLSIAVQAFVSRVSMSFSVDETLLPR